MKFTNIKQLIIKFVGGGIINFPTRFLRWVKINGDADGSDDDEGGSDGDINILDYFPFDFSDDKPVGFVIRKDWNFAQDNFPDGVDERTYKYVIDDDSVIYPMENLTNEFYQQYRIDNNQNSLKINLLYESYQNNAVTEIGWGMQFPQYNNNTDITINTRKTEYALINNGHIYYMQTTGND